MFAQDASNNEHEVPYFKPGTIMYLYGKAPQSGQFNIDLIPRYDGEYTQAAICLRVTVDIDSYHITRNSFAHEKWLYEEVDGYSGIRPRRFFAITILVQVYGYEISIDGYHFATYNHRVPFTEYMKIVVDDHVNLEPIEVHY